MRKEALVAAYLHAWYTHMEVNRDTDVSPIPSQILAFAPFTDKNQNMPFFSWKQSEMWNCAPTDLRLNCKAFIFLNTVSSCISKCSCRPCQMTTVYQTHQEHECKYSLCGIIVISFQFIQMSWQITGFGLFLIFNKISTLQIGFALHSHWTCTLNTVDLCLDWICLKTM